MNIIFPFPLALILVSATYQETAGYFYNSLLFLAKTKLGHVHRFKIMYKNVLSIVILCAKFIQTWFFFQNSL